MFLVYLKVFRIHYSHKRIVLDPAKAKRIEGMKPPTTCKKLKSFMGRLSYVRGFIPALVELLNPFHKLLKKNAPLRSG